MTTPGGGLARIIMLAPKRRIEVAVPEHVPIIGMLPALLEHGGPSLAEDGVEHGGWVLRRLDGTLLRSDRSLAALGVHDGETLVLSPRDQEWPEPSFDDVAEAVASTAQRLGWTWTASTTLATGRVAAGIILLFGLVAIVASPTAGRLGGFTAYGVALGLLVAAGVLARVMTDRVTAAMLAGFGAGYAALGGLLTPAIAPLTGGITAWQWVSGAASLLFASAAARVLLPSYGQFCVAGVTFAAAAGIAALLTATGVTTVSGAAAVIAGLVALTVFVLPRLAMYQGGVPAPPMPSLTGAAEEPPPPEDVLAVAVRRSDELLTGLLMGVCAALAVCEWLLAVRWDLGELLLLGAVLLLCALRARAFVAQRHRLSLLLASAAGAAALMWHGWQSLAPQGRSAALIPMLGALLITAGLAITVGSHYSRKEPSPHLGRISDIVDVLLTVAVPILVALVLGLFGYMRGLLGG
ncbi:type VII secretion system ESX-4 subunit EccD4 [Micromonospora sonneratiae]|uniref:Type VII secretion integral membrane protein EccD n=1 Tax=Micromonospora sonneratiae TaxID=1184706 RepID=A0ABW3YN68_9ACTN